MSVSTAPRSSAAAPGLSIREAVQALKRERITMAAAQLFYERGYGNTTLDAVAEHLQVTKPYIYARFGSKSELLAEICGRGIRASLAALDRVLASPDAPATKLRVLVRDFILTVLENQRCIAIYSRELKHLAPADARAIQALRREFDRKFQGLLRQGIAAGELQVPDERMAALAIGGIVSWSHVWFRPDGRLSASETADRICNLVLAMTHARPARGHRATTVSEGERHGAI